MSSRIATIDLAPATEALLQGTFFETFPVRISERLIGRVAALQPDLLVHDMRGATEPGRDETYAPVLALKSDRETAEIPLIALVQDGRPELRLQALAAGADEVLSHRRELALLPARAAGLIRGHSALRELCLHAGTAFALGFSPDEAEGGSELPEGALALLSPRETASRLIPPLKAAFGMDVCRAGDSGQLFSILKERTIHALLIDGRGDPAAAIRTAAGVSGLTAIRRPPVLLLVEAGQLAVVRRGLEIGAIDAVAITDEPCEIAGRLRVLVRRNLLADSLRRLAMRSDRMAVTDCLTGLHNRRYAMCHLERMVARSTATGDALSLLTIDVDGLKRFNDEMGHAAGDAALTTVARRLRRAVRGPDLLARIGGDEFLLAMPGVSEARVRAAVRRLRDRVRHEPLSVCGHPPRAVSISIGAATLRQSESVESLMARSDRALHENRSDFRTCGGARPPSDVEGTPANLAHAPREREPG